MRRIAIAFHACMLLAIVLTVLLNMYYSYFDDFQAQGRYSFSTILAIGYLFARGVGFLVDRIRARRGRIVVTAAVCLALAAGLVYATWGVMLPSQGDAGTQVNSTMTNEWVAEHTE